MGDVIARAPPWENTDLNKAAAAAAGPQPTQSSLLYFTNYLHHYDTHAHTFHNYDQCRPNIYTTYYTKIIHLYSSISLRSATAIYFDILSLY